MQPIDRIPTNYCPKVFVQRDFSDGMFVKFQSRLPPELEGKIERQAYESTITKINNFYADAEALKGSAYCENFFACLTCYFSMFCIKTHYDKVLDKLSTYIEEQNRKVYIPRNLLLINPIERGLRTLEIVILQDTPK